MTEVMHPLLLKSVRIMKGKAEENEFSEHWYSPLGSRNALTTRQTKTKGILQALLFLFPGSAYAHLENRTWSRETPDLKQLFHIFMFLRATL